MPPRMPSMFVTHGGGPLPLLGDRGHAPLTAFLKGASKLLPAQPSAIVVVTAHWGESVPTASTSPSPPMLYDYGGFPPEAYQIQYPAPGASRELVDRVKELLASKGIPLQENSRRGFDHGTFVPLKLMFPANEIPVLQLSHMSSLDPKAHIAMGQALAPLRDDSVLLLGSGSSVHNLPAMMASFRSGRPQPALASGTKDFDSWLCEVCTQNTGAEREARLEKWEAAPGGTLSHPSGDSDHLVPLMFAVGAAGQDQGRAVGQFELGGFPASSFIFE